MVEMERRKESTICFIRFPNTEKRVKAELKIRLVADRSIYGSGVFLTRFEVFGNVMKHALKVFDISSQLKLKLRSKHPGNQTSVTVMISLVLG